MRFAIVTETYPPEVNGVALTVQGLEHGLRALGHEVGLVRPRQPDTPDALTGDALLVAGAGVPRYPGLRFGFPAGQQLAARWRRQRPDAIYVATEGPLGWSAVRAARRLRIPVATGFHTRFDDYATRYGAAALAPLVFAWLRRFHNHADATLVPTRELQEFLHGRGFRQVQQLSRAVDTRQFDPRRRSADLRSQWGLAPDALAVVHVGRIAAEKNLPLAIAAFRALQAKQPEARFVFVGDGPERAALLAAHPDFIHCGVQRGDALASHFASADLFLFPSLSETFGNVTLEAMASGVATVAYDYGAAREHIRSGISGIAVRCGDEPAFIAAATSLAEDAVTRARIGKCARAAVEMLEPAGVATQFAALLAGLPSRQAA